MAQEDEQSGGMQLVSKSMAILTAIGQAGSISVKELAERTGEPASSLYRLLSSLEVIGWVEPAAKPRQIRLGVEFLRLGARLEAQLDVRKQAVPQLEWLRQASGETAFLCIRRGLEAVCIERVEGLDVQIHTLSLGQSMPLGEGVAPRALLAFEPKEVVDSYFENFPEPTSAIAPSAEELRVLLAETARDGVAVATSEWADGIGGVGAPIFDHRGRVVAALSIGGMSHRMFGGSYDAVALTRSAAEAVSRSMGYDGGIPAPRPLPDGFHAHSEVA
ncbi:IclR family transcriptional regulator (plasmid) [Arthrobacter sp. UC242_113]|uniref:IclR family transcriptional regulator n=1 Tax=Arthrobacter sp. UC242_113 TaxID=3374550 RepID=UPI0037570B16